MKAHWEKVFETKDTTKVSWYQEKPSLGLSLIEKYCIDKNTAILDIGGGDSRIPDFLLKKNYTDVSILDLSSQALQASKIRLDKDAQKIKWIESDITAFKAAREYDIWYDRAVFHFLNTENDQQAYKNALINSMADKGKVIIGSFSKNGMATRCSGIDICQHDRESYTALFDNQFDIIEYFEDTHTTPSGGEQLFSWVVLRKK